MKITDHKFQDLSLLEAALTHPSCTRNGDEDIQHYQRLEFLGDRVLSLVVAETLFAQYPEDTEGSLTLKLIKLVRKETIATVAHDLGLSPYIRINEEKILATNDNVLSDIVEAIIGAIYLDSGLDASADFVRKHWQPYIADLTTVIDKDAKSMLQEWSQKNLKTLPIYKILESSGPAHAPSFMVEVRAGNHKCAAHGSSKKKAEVAAASKCLQMVLRDQDDTMLSTEDHDINQ